MSPIEFQVLGHSSEPDRCVSASWGHILVRETDSQQDKEGKCVEDAQGRGQGCQVRRSMPSSFAMLL